MRNILLVEDEQDILFANKVLLERRGGYAVQLAASLAEARRCIAEFTPDLIVLDIMLPDGSGLDFLAELRDGNLATPSGSLASIPVLLLTALSETSDEVKGIQSGGDDYITKPYDNKVLLARIERALHRASQMPATLSIGRIKIDTASKRAYADGNDMDLTFKEVSLLVHFVQNPKKIMSREYLYEKIWAQKMGSDDRSLRTTISTLRTKLAKYNAGYTITASKGEGYYFVSE